MNEEICLMIGPKDNAEFMKILLQLLMKSLVTLLKASTLIFLMFW